MSEKSKQQEEAEEAATFFNRGRRYSAEIVRDNEQLRLKILRLELTLRGTTVADRRKGACTKPASVVE